MRTIQLAVLVCQGQPLEPIAQLARLNAALSDSQAPLQVKLVLCALQAGAEILTAEGIAIRVRPSSEVTHSDVRAVVGVADSSEVEPAADWLKQAGQVRAWASPTSAMGLGSDILFVEHTALCAALGRALVALWTPEAIARWATVHAESTGAAQGAVQRPIERKTAHPKLAEALALMKANFEEPLPGDDIARLVGVSRRQLERLFKQHLDTLPSKHYLELRLAHARLLLQDSSQSILQVGLACGFSSGPHFSSTYRAHFGITPREERSRRVSTYWQAGSSPA
jgi:transcriptional regulator GlxA family with amidase domain